MIRKLGLAFVALMFSVAAYAANVPSLPLTAAAVTANASWTTSSTQITLTTICPQGYFNGAPVTDTTLVPNVVIGQVASCVGNTLNLVSNAAYASSGSADKLSIASTASWFNEPSQQLNMVNFYNGMLNANTSGLFASLAAPITTSGTTANTILSNANVMLPYAGQTIRSFVWGVNSADSNAKTVTFNFGASGTCAVVVTGSSAKWFAKAEIQNVGTVASPAWQMLCWGQQGSTAITVNTASGTDALNTAAQTLNVTATAATSGTMTVNGADFEYVK